MFPFYQVDAFADRPLGGNPCAVVFDADALDAPTMQAIAREMNLSETAFVRRSDGCRFRRALLHAPTEEIPLAGHPTIATTFALVDAGRIALTGALTQITLELQVGPIAVEIAASGAQVTRITMTQKPPQFLETL